MKYFWCFFKGLQWNSKDPIRLYVRIGSGMSPNYNPKWPGYMGVVNHQILQKIGDGSGFLGFQVPFCFFFSNCSHPREGGCDKFTSCAIFSWWNLFKEHHGPRKKGSMGRLYVTVCIPTWMVDFDGKITGWWFQIFCIFTPTCSPLPGEDSHFD